MTKQRRRWQLAQHHGLGSEAPELVDRVTAPGGNDPQLVAVLMLPFMTRTSDTNHIVVEPRVDDQRLQRRVGIALGRRDALDQRFQQIGYALARLGADTTASVASMPMISRSPGSPGPGRLTESILLMTAGLRVLLVAV